VYSWVRRKGGEWLTTRVQLGFLLGSRREHDNDGHIQDLNLKRIYGANLSIEFASDQKVAHENLVQVDDIQLIALDTGIIGRLCLLGVGRFVG